MAAASVVLSHLSSTSSNSSSPSIPSPNSSSIKDQKTTSELLKTMVNDAMLRKSSGIKTEIEDDEIVIEDECPTTSNNYQNSNKISTTKIFQIPTELSPQRSKTTTPDQFTSSILDHIGHNHLNYMQLHRPKTRIVHNMVLNKLTISRKSNYIHVDTTVHVPRSDDVGEFNETSSRGRKTPSPLLMNDGRKDKNAVPKFTSWLSEHFRASDPIKSPQIATSNRKSIFQPHSSIKFNQSNPSTTSKSSVNQGKKLPQWLLQLAQNAAQQNQPATKGLISAGRTVEIPAKESVESPKIDPIMLNRKSQRLMDKSVVETVRMENNKQMANKGDNDPQYRELRNEISKMRKQICRDRNRFLDESRSMRKEMAQLRETILLALQITQLTSLLNGQQTNGSNPSSFLTNLNGKRTLSDEDNEEEPNLKKIC